MDIKFRIESCLQVNRFRYELHAAINDTDKDTEANKPDIVLLDKKDRKYFIIDIACPFDTRIGSKQKEKIGRE